MAFITGSGFARTTEAQQRAETDEYQRHSARFRNDGDTIDFVAIPAAGRSSQDAVDGVGSRIRIQPEGRDGVRGKVRSYNAAERQSGTRSEAQRVPSAGRRCPVEDQL